MASDEPRTCVICRQPLPPKSKLTTANVVRDEAERSGWTGEPNSDGTVVVDMCLQCQIARSHARRYPPLE